MKKIMLATVLSMLAVASQASPMSDEFVANTGVSLKAGSDGVGFDVSHQFNDLLSLRLGYSEMSVSRNYNKDNVSYNGKIKLGGYDLLADYHPFSSGFRLTGGVYSPTTKFNGTATNTGTITLNGTSYASGQVGVVNADAKWNGVKPYLGLGYDGFNKVKEGFYFTADAGVIFSGSPSVNVSATCLNPAICTQLTSDVNAEQAKVQSDLHKVNVLPVLQVGVGYRF